ncbi:MAG TPA: shikimate kinase [Candidatus Thermoplasmatota archaeon]
MTGTGTAGGAGTIVNAIATGKGAAFGLDLHVTATVDESITWMVTSNGEELDTPAAKLALESARQVCVPLRKKQPHLIDIQSDIPPERGLKSSSAVSVAVIRATLDAHGVKWPAARILKSAARAGLRSGTSITGAYDDAAACLLGGAVVTDNKRFRLLQRGELPRNVAALVNVPPVRLKTSAVRKVDFSGVRGLVKEAWELARAGEYDKAMILNSAAYAAILGHETKFTFEAIREGAWAAGLSGKGPAEIALGPRALLERLRSTYPSSFVVSLRRGVDA